MSKNIYESKQVALSRLYPFGDKKKATIRKEEREITVLTVNELNGIDDEQLLKKGQATVYDEISISCGITEKEAASLSRADAQLVNAVQQGFLYDSAEIVLID